MMKAQELREQTIEELKALEREERKTLFALRNQQAKTKKVEPKVRQTKLGIARILTVLREKEMQA